VATEIKSFLLIAQWHIYKKWLTKYFAKKSFKGLQNRSFSIFASNCTAGFIYQDAGLAYRSPTVGLFFYSPCYIKLLQNFHWVNDPLQFAASSKYGAANQARQLNNNFYPIGVIGGDIEIHFLHYHSAEEAAIKWTRRLAKLDYNNLLFLFSARDMATDELIEDFCNLPLPNKLCFTVKQFGHLKNTVHFKQYQKLGEMPPADIARISVLQKVDFAAILNKLPLNTTSFLG
jgi:uncharacterized protein (DUF1919 family)